MKKLSSTLVIVLIIFSIMCFAPLVSGEGARIWTDKEEYVSHETVTIFGSGFLPNVEVTITIVAPDSSVGRVYAWTDELGAFTAQYVLDGQEGTYTVTATDGTNTATTTFLEPPTVNATWSDSDCANIKATASGLATSKSYYVTYADPDGVVRRTSPTYTGVSSFIDYFVLDIALPKVLGTWTVRLYETPATLKKTDTVAVGMIVWTTDSTYTVMQTSFAQGDTVYFKAIGLLTSKYYKFRLDPPDGHGSSIYVGAWTTGVTTLTGSYALPSDAPTGTWKLHVRQADNGAGSHEGHYVDRYFTVTPYTPPSTAKVTFSQVGVGTDFTEPVLKVDGVNYTVVDLPKDFTWVIGSEHTFAYYSHFVVNGKRYVWTSTSGLSTEQGGTIIVPADGGAVTGYYKTQFYLTVVSPYGTPGGEGWYDMDSTAYATVTPLIVLGPAGVRYVFTQWGGDATGATSPSDLIIMDAPKTAMASWKTEYQLTVRTSGLGTYTTKVYNGTTILGTATDAAPYTGWFEEGGLILLNVDSPIVDGSKRFVFTQWTGDASGSEPSKPVTMNSPKDITANYKTQYLVSFTQTGSGVAPSVTYTADTDPTGTVPFTVWVKAGSQITYEYQGIVPGAPGVRYVFTGVTPLSPQTVTGPLTVSGAYKTQYLLTALTDPAGLSPQPTRNPTGESGPPNGWWYDPATSVTLTAQTVTGYNFNYWDVDGTQKSGNPISVPMDGPHTATAHYTPIITYTLTITANTGGTTNPSPGTSTHTAGTPVPVTATPNSGYIFDHWELDGVNVGSVNPYTVTMNKDHTLKAVFALPAKPVGGYSVSLTKQTFVSHITVYTMLIALFGAVLILTKRKRK
jgi:hypothetical protein